MNLPRGRTNAPEVVRGGELRSGALRTIWMDVPLFTLTASYVVVALLANLFIDGRRVLEFSAEGLLVFTAFAWVAGSAAMWRLLRTGHSMMRAHTWRRFVGLISWPALFRYVSACVLIWPFLDALGWTKANIGRFATYAWDPLLARVDRTLHFGSNPGDLLAAAFPGPGVVRFLDWIYHPGWMGAFVAGVLWFGFVENDLELRTRVLLSFALVWIVLGSVGATMLASVGPCYYGDWIAGDDPFAALMDGLREVHRSDGLFSIRSQQILWAGFRGEGIPLGVSAMPSVHVALTAVLALSLRGRWRRVGALFLVLILLGSVRLGWHYAIDGYASIAAVGFMWVGTGRFVRWWASVGTGSMRVPDAAPERT